MQVDDALSANQSKLPERTQQLDDATLTNRQHILGGAY
jgi:hypothetical protein